MMKDTSTVTWGDAPENVYTVIEREGAEGPHPHPRFEGKIVPFKTVNRLLLDNGTEVFECDFPGAEDCTYLASSVKSVTSHQPVHGENKNEPLYPVETIKAVLRAAKIALRDGGQRAYAERAASELRTAGVKRLDGQPFTAADVSRINREYKDRYRVHVPNGTKRVKELTQAADALDAVDLLRSPIATDNIEARFSAIAGGVEAMAHGLNTLVMEIQKLKADVAAQHTEATVDSTLADKARRWDEFQALMNGTQK